VLALVDGIADDAPIVANRVAALVSKLFNFALDRVRDDNDDPILEHSPATRIPRPGAESERDRVLSADELRRIWTTAETFDPEMAAFYKLRLLTAQRGGEVSTMRWCDVDLDGGWWTIPATSTKNKIQRRVPLAATALDLLKALKMARDAEPFNPDDVGPVTIERRTYVLAGARGKRQQGEAAAAFTVEDFRGHDLRRTAATMMTSGGVPRDSVARVLNHKQRDVTRVYDRYSYDAEKRAALVWWDAKLRSILDETRGTVLRFAARA
jgi:integrase